MEHFVWQGAADYCGVSAAQLLQEPDQNRRRSHLSQAVTQEDFVP